MLAISVKDFSLITVEICTLIFLRFDLENIINYYRQLVKVKVNPKCIFLAKFLLRNDKALIFQTFTAKNNFCLT